MRGLFRFLCLMDVAHFLCTPILYLTTHSDDMMLCKRYNLDVLWFTYAPVLEHDL